MSILAIGGEPDSVELAEGSYVFDTTGGHFESNAARGGLKSRAGTQSYLFKWGDVTEVWFHADMYQVSHGAGDVLIFYKDDNTNAFKLTEDAAGKWQAKIYDSASYTNIGSLSAAAVLDGDKHEIDVHILIDNASGVFEVFRDGVSIISFSGDTLRDSSAVGYVKLYSIGGTSDMTYSQLIAADESTVDMKVATIYPTGAGATTDWSGSYADVDESDYDNATQITTPDTGDVDTFAAANINAAYGSYTVKALAVAMRGEIASDSAVTNVLAAVRISGTDYYSSDIGLANDDAEHSAQHVFNLNPATSGAWSQSAVNGAEIGVKSA